MATSRRRSIYINRSSCWLAAVSLQLQLESPRRPRLFQWHHAALRVRPTLAGRQRQVTSSQWERSHRCGDSVGVGRGHVAHLVVGVSEPAVGLATSEPGNHERRAAHQPKESRAQRRDD